MLLFSVTTRPKTILFSETNYSFLRPSSCTVHGGFAFNLFLPEKKILYDKKLYEHF